MRQALIMLIQALEATSSELAKRLGEILILLEAPVTPPAPPSDELLPNGVIRLGVVESVWEHGTPIRFHHLENKQRTAQASPELWEAICNYWPEDLRVKAIHVAFLESDFRANAHNAVGEDSWGIFQVNRKAWPEYPVETLTTYEGCSMAGAYIYSVQGWPAWWNAANLLKLL